MTETELSERIAELTQSDEETEKKKMQARRRTRRRTNVIKNDRRLRIINHSGYAPHLGYVDWDFDGTTLLHSGKHIKYPKTSNCQRWMKRKTSKRVRNCGSVSPKGNHYRRLFDYWWTLY